MIPVPHQTEKHQQLKSYIAHSVKENKNTLSKLSFYLAKHMYGCCQQQPMMLCSLVAKENIIHPSLQIHTHFIRVGVFPMFSLYTFDRSKINSLFSRRCGIIPPTRVGYEMIESQRGASRREAVSWSHERYCHVISNKREYNCFTKTLPKTKRKLKENGNKESR